MKESIGIVYLVGAGPGDPGLITTKGLRRIQGADVVVYDRLVDKRLLSEAPKDAEIIYVGKNAHLSSGAEQEQISSILIEKARKGKRVVRLKGGDPFVFGRGGEEAQMLRMADIPFEVVPGITSAIGVPAYAGIPVTHRGTASSFTVVSGVESFSKERSAIEWDSLANTGGTLVILMAWGTLDKLVSRLTQSRMKPSTPVALVQWGTEPYQRTVTGTLKNIVQLGQQANLNPPVIVVIGSVVALREKIRWFDNYPLFGKRILVTRSQHQASALCMLLTDEGADPVEVPAIHIAPLDDYKGLDGAILSINKYQWIIFTSVNGVEAFFRRLHAQGCDSRSLAKTKICAIGSTTTASLERFGIKADLIPSQFNSNSIIKGLANLGIRGARILIPQADIAPHNLVKEIESLGAKVDHQPAYRTLVPESSHQKATETLKTGKIDIVTFTSSSSVRNLVHLIGGDTALLTGKLIACIGPVTSQTAKEIGLEVNVVASQHTVEGMINALKKHLLRNRGE